MSFQWPFGYSAKPQETYTTKIKNLGRSIGIKAKQAMHWFQALYNKALSKIMVSVTKRKFVSFVEQL
jgi:hypothetical protein